MSDQNKEQELIEQLSSDKRSLRIQAVVKLTRVGNSQAALAALSALAAKGDREEAFFISQAIAKITQKLEKKLGSFNNTTPNTSEVTETPQNTNNANQYYYQNNSETKSLTTYDFLSATNERAATLLKYVREHPSEIPEALLPSVGVFLGKFGDTRDSDFILKYLQTHHNTLTLPYISAAEKIDSKILIPVLPYLLASKEALVRSRAVMVLQKIDQTEAERHFLHLLASTQAEDRLAALEISFLFPFNRVKNYIVALLPEEKDADVFKACATVLASNPSLDLALRILDVLETLPPQQRKPITAIFNILSVAIKSARVLPAQEATPQALVLAWKRERLKKFLNDLEIQLCTTTGERREGLISWLEKNINIPDVAEFVEHLSLNPQTEDVYQRLTSSNNDNLVLPNIESIFDSASNASSAKPVPIKNKPQEKKIEPQIKPEVRTETQRQNSYSSEQETAVPELTEVPDSSSNAPTSSIEKPLDADRQQIKQLKTLDMQQFLTEKQSIIDLAENSFTSIPVRVEALNTLLRLSPGPKLKTIGVKALDDTDIKIKTAGFKILERVAPDVLKDKLSELLLSTDTNIRVRAIRFGLKVNQEESIQALEKLISSSDQNHRSYAISCLALCPFESVYHILIKALLNEKYDLVAKQITAVLLSNPDPVILSMLDKISVIATDPNIEMVVSQARNELEEILNSMPAKQSDLKEIDVFQKSTDKIDKPYSVENVRKLTNKIASEKKQSDKNASGKKSFSDILKNINGTTLMVVGLVILVVSGTIYGILNPPKTGSFNPSKYKQENRTNERNIGRKGFGGSSGSSLRMNRTSTITGDVTQIISETSLVMVSDSDKSEVMVKFKGKEAKGLKKGDKIRVTCMPYKKNPNNIILANGSKLTKISDSK